MSGPAASSAVLRTEQHGAVRHLVLDRPRRRNALDAALVEALDRALLDAERDPATRALLLCGSGPSFCAGADLRHLLDLHESGADPVPFLSSVSALTRRLELSPLPVVAALHGHVVAGGLEIALACDVVVAEAGTVIGDGHLRNHLLPGAGSSVRLARKVGDPLARWLALTGELVPAERFLSVGWLHELAPPGRAVASAQRAADLLAAAANPAQSVFKRLLADLNGSVTDNGLARELDAFGRHWASHDVPARLREFLAQRASSGVSAGKTAAS